MDPLARWPVQSPTAPLAGGDDASQGGKCMENTYADPVYRIVPQRPDHHRVAVDRDAVAEHVIRSAVARGQLVNLRPVGGEVAGRVAREHVRGPAVGSLVVVLPRPDHHRVAIDRHAVAEESFAAPSSAVSLATCVQLEARSPAVSRVNTYADPLFIPCRRPMRPDHHRVAVDRHAVAELVTRSAVVRGQLGDLRPAGGEVAGRVARVHVRGPAVGLPCRRPKSPRSPSCRRRSRRCSRNSHLQRRRPRSAWRPASSRRRGCRLWSRVNTYADPLLSPLTSSSSECAAITIVSPSIDTL